MQIKYSTVWEECTDPQTGMVYSVAHQVGRIEPEAGDLPPSEGNLRLDSIDDLGKLSDLFNKLPNCPISLVIHAPCEPVTFEAVGYEENDDGEITVNLSEVKGDDDAKE